MQNVPYESTDALKQALPALAPDALLQEAKNAFSYYGNAVVNNQYVRIDDAIERFNAVQKELAIRLRLADSRHQKTNRARTA